MMPDRNQSQVKGEARAVGSSDMERRARSMLRFMQKKEALIGEDCNRAKKFRFVRSAAVKDHCDEADQLKGKSVAADLVWFCLAQDWLERTRMGLQISEVGHAWLRRGSNVNDCHRRQHQLRRETVKEVAGGVSRTVIVNDGESPLGWLRKRKDRHGKPLISDVQFEAGERLANDYWLAKLTPKVTSDWSGVHQSKRRRRGAGGSEGDVGLGALAARDRVRKALESVGPEFAGLLVDICCNLRGLEDAEKVNGWPQRSAKVVLQLALTSLARHYGLMGEDTTYWRRREIGHWGACDFKPNLEDWNAS